MKDFNSKHGHLPTRNLYVIKLMQSFKSKGFVNETFSWQWHYFYLNNEGIEYLREYLHLPEEVVPRTLKPKKGPQRVTTGRPQDIWRSQIKSSRSFQGWRSLETQQQQ